MMPWFRRRTRGFATVLLASLASIGAWSVVAHGADCHDAGCAIVAVAHDASAHAFRAPAPAAAGHLHCILCHSVRSVRPPVSAPQVLSEVSGRDVRVRVADAGVIRGPVAAQPPLRSPPAPTASTFLA